MPGDTEDALKVTQGLCCGARGQCQGLSTVNEKLTLYHPGKGQLLGHDALAHGKQGQSSRHLRPCQGCWGCRFISWEKPGDRGSEGLGL